MWLHVGLKDGLGKGWVRTKCNLTCWVRVRVRWVGLGLNITKCLGNV